MCQMSAFLWHLALCCALGLLMENNVGKVPDPVHSGQEGETINNKISEDAAKEINRVIRQTEPGRERIS